MIPGNQPSSSSVDVSNLDAAMHVSLVGQTDQKGDAAPNGGQVTTDKSLSVDGVARVLRIIEDVSCAGNRTKAVEEITAGIAVRFPNASVRCGLGSQQLKRFYDRKLGWLGTESSLHIAGEAKWADLPLDDANCHFVEGGVAICLPEVGGDGRCVIWIESDQLREGDVDWILGGLQTIRVVFWQRPVRSWLRASNAMSVAPTIWLSLAMSVLLLVAIWPVHYRISCTAVVEPIQQRLVAAPFEATLLANHVKPGDAVQAGDVLVEFDGRPLRLELESIASEIQQATKQHDVALATGKVAEAQQASLKQQQLARQRDLITDRLERLKVVSPIDGVIVAGDLDRFVGSPLKTGQTLVEVAPLDRMMIEIEIPEHEIGYVRSDADTKIKIAAIGGRSIRATLSDVYPTAEVREDQNVFVGRTEINNHDKGLRPGMRGEATTYGPLRPFAWSWLRGGYEKLLWWSGF